MNVDDAADDVSSVNEDHMATNGQVAMMRWRWREMPAKVPGHSVTPPAQFAIERPAFLQARLLVGG